MIFELDLPPILEVHLPNLPAPTLVSANGNQVYQLYAGHAGVGAAAEMMLLQFVKTKNLKHDATQLALFPVFS